MASNLSVIFLGLAVLVLTINNILTDWKLSKLEKEIHSVKFAQLMEEYMHNCKAEDEAASKPDQINETKA